MVTMGLAGIPSPKEIANMTKEAMDPMARDISAIRNAIERLVELKEIEMGIRPAEAVA